MKLSADLRPFDLVAVNSEPDGALFRVQSIDGYRVTVTDCECPDCAPQIIDKSLLLRPTRAQLAAASL